jgi:hypothetical protein
MSRCHFTVALSFIVLVVLPCGFTSAQKRDDIGGVQTELQRPQSWQTSARLRRAFKTAEPGTLRIGPDAIAFAGRESFRRRWPFREIKTLEISAHQLLLTSYENRTRHRPGDRRYRFHLESALPSQVAEQITRSLGKPSRNANPELTAAVFASIPAKRRKPFGGSNGELRFRPAGIDFITDAAGEARAWRWADIQTLANPDPYHFRVAGLLEVYEFELKEPMSSRLFDRLWDSVYAPDLNSSDGRAEGINDRQP